MDAHERRTIASVAIHALINPTTADAVTSLGQCRNASTRESPMPQARDECDDAQREVARAEGEHSGERESADGVAARKGSQDEPGA
jgi:hypothetical protein